MIVVYLGFTKSIPFRHHYTISAAFTDRQQHQQELAGADRRRQRRQGHRGRAPARRRPTAAIVTMQIDEQGPADPQGRAARDPPADLPRGQLLRRRQAGSPVGADARRRRHDPDQPDRARRSSSTRSSRRCRRATRQDLQQLLDELSAGSRARGGARLQPLDPVLEARLPRLGDRHRGDARAGPARPVELHRGRGRGGRRARPEPGRSCRAWSPTSTRPPARSRRRTPASRRRSPSCRARCASGRPRSRALNAALPAVARFAHDLRPGVRSSGPTIDAALPFVTSCAASSRQPELRGLVARPAPDGPGAGAAQRRQPCRSTSRSARPRAARTTVILPWTARQDPGPSVPGRRARSTTSRSSPARHRAARAARATPTASGSACSPAAAELRLPRPARQLPAQRRPDPGRATRRSRPRAPAAAPRRARARRSSRRTCASTRGPPPAGSDADRAAHRPAGCARDRGRGTTARSTHGLRKQLKTRAPAEPAAVDDTPITAKQHPAHARGGGGGK